MFDNDFFDDDPGYCPGDGLGLVDLNISDSFEFDVDLDGDDNIDITSFGYIADMDHDDNIDSVVFDYDGDGVVDTIADAHCYDDNGDGVPDYIEIDLDGDNDIDMVFHLDLDGRITGIDMDDTFFGQLDDFIGKMWEDFQYNTSSEWDVFENFDISDYDPATILGHPEEAVTHWHEQTGNTCAVCAQEFIYEQFTGRDISQDEMVSIAMALGVYDNGTAPNDVGKILEFQGFNVDRSYDNSMKDLISALEHGSGVIVGVDSSEIWYPEGSEWFDTINCADHAVQVIGIDISNSNSPMVILNDSGHPDGCGSMIPLDVFLNAWEDSGFFMTEVYP